MEANRPDEIHTFRGTGAAGRGRPGSRQGEFTAVVGHAMSDRLQRTQTRIDAIATPFDRAWRASGRHGRYGEDRTVDCLAGLLGLRRCGFLGELR